MHNKLFADIMNKTAMRERRRRGAARVLFKKRGKAVQMPNLFEHLHGLDELFIHIPDHYKTV
jgi:hypothetical protein